MVLISLFILLALFGICFLFIEWEDYL